MDMATILSITISIVVVTAIVLLVMLRKKYEPLTYAEHFMPDKSGAYIHILGARRIMPDEGDSFDIFEHYVFDHNQLRFFKGGSQRGKNLELKSEFVKRSLAQLSQSLHTALEFKLRDEDYDEDEDDLLKVYRFESVQSDTEVYEPMKPDSLVFINQGDEGDHFTMSVYRGGNLLKKHPMRGMSDYFFKTIYLEEKGWLCFLYRKQKLTISGMALCIINYHTGEMIFDDFVRPSKKS